MNWIRPPSTRMRTRNAKLPTGFTFRGSCFPSVCQPSARPVAVTFRTSRVGRHWHRGPEPENTRPCPQLFPCPPASQPLPTTPMRGRERGGHNRDILLVPHHKLVEPFCNWVFRIDDVYLIVPITGVRGKMATDHRPVFRALPKRVGGRVNPDVPFA